MPDEQLAQMTARQLRSGYESGALTPTAVAETVLGRIERLNGDLTAFVTVTGDEARQTAADAERVLRGDGRADDSAGALCGVPVSIKDMIVTRGVRTTIGSLLLADWVPDFDSPTSERLRAAAAPLLGKTTSSEFGWKGESGNRVVGPARNPWRLDRTAGGSSGGAAAAVAAGLGPVAIGSDGAGSVRIPAAFCGVFGIKPSQGVIPVFPISPIETLSHLGVLATTVADAADVLDVVAGPDPRDRFSLPDTGADYASSIAEPIGELRIAWSPDLGYAAVESEVRESTATAAAVFESLGCQVSEVVPGWDDPYPFLDVIWSAANAGRHMHDLEEVRDLIDPGRLEVVERGMRLTGPEVAAANAAKADFAETVRQFMDGYDLLLTPTLPLTAFAAGADQPGQVAGRPTEYLRWTPFTYPFNICGLPAASVPCGMAGGLPVGLQIVGGWRQDALVMRAAAAFEEAAPWPRHAVGEGLSFD
jgi:aspartyl-tRNA(Asn)/glutamyl-tRNA(Gln) amidotransferase subunit A